LFPLRHHAERFGEPGGRRRGLLALGREVELDPLARAITGEQAALGVKAHLLRRRHVPVLPQDVSARQGRVAAQGDLDRRMNQRRS